MHQRARSLAVVATAGIGMCGIGACGLGPGTTFRDDAEVSQKITAIRLDNTSGGLTVHGGESADGSLKLSAVGAVRVTTSSGTIDLDGVTGPVDATTSDGAITGRGLSGRRITAETSNGEIDLTPATAQSIRAKTSSGSITVTVPKARYRVSAETGNGDKRLGVVQDPAGRYRLDLSTGNGDVTAKSA